MTYAQQRPGGGAGAAAAAASSPGRRLLVLLLTLGAIGLASARMSPAATAVAAARSVGPPSATAKANRLPAPRGGAAAPAAAATSPLGAFLRTVKEARRHLVAAAVARSLSIFSMYPVDTIKTRMQMELPSPFRTAGLYSGVGGSLIGQVPYGVLTFGSYEIYKQALLERLPNVRPALVYALSAVLGDVTGSGWLCPSEVVKQQMQAGMYGTTPEAVRGIWAKRGPRGFYQGYLGGLARDVPFRVAQLTSYEVTKNLYLRVKARRMGRDADAGLELSPGDAAVCGAIAGSFSAAITNPLDRIKTLLMTGSAGYGTSVASCAAKIWADEGIRGFCQGAGARTVYIAPSVAIFFIAYEQVQQRLGPGGE